MENQSRAVGRADRQLDRSKYGGRRRQKKALLRGGQIVPRNGPVRLQLGGSPPRTNDPQPEPLNPTAQIEGLVVEGHREIGQKLGGVAMVGDEVSGLASDRAPTAGNLEVDGARVRAIRSKVAESGGTERKFSNRADRPRILGEPNVGKPFSRVVRSRTLEEILKGRLEQRHNGGLARVEVHPDAL